MPTTLDSIKDIKLLQSKTGYRFSIDALLLENFISVKHPLNAVELGAGSGIISILLSKRLKALKILAVEIQKSLSELAEKNIIMNKLEGRIEVLKEDIRNLKNIFPSNQFDLVFSNPPFREAKSGRLCLDEERAVARHEIKITISELVQTASHLLKTNGKFCLIYHPFRLTGLIDILRRSGIEPKRMRFVHAQKGKEAKMALVEAVKGAGAGLKIEPPIFVYEKPGQYTDEIKKIYGDKT